MNIKRVKDEIRQAVQAYLSKNEFGQYKIPVVNQRPIVLIGPPGIGKTAIMEQVARESEIGLVAYTITHHTRQSAIGLPFIEKKQYGGKEYSVTEYTMSEIIASVYEKMEQTGLKEGILFIDEINCVSETLSATMLQFLQGKSFGSHKVPEGWIIVAAGNPPEYNKSVKEFDIVTLDRVRQLNVTEDYKVWKEYAYKYKVHNAIISYLDIKKEHFYSIETTVDGKRFVTARGWEDLSKLLYVYEELGFDVDEHVIYQYIQQPKIAKEFSNYLDLYNKYKDQYQIGDILEGKKEQVMVARLMDAPFDERLSVIGLMLSKLYDKFQLALWQDAYVTELYDALKQVKENLFEQEENNVIQVLQRTYKNREKQWLRLKVGNLLEKQEEQLKGNVLLALEGYIHELQGKVVDADAAFAYMKEQFEKETAERANRIEAASRALENGFLLMEEAFMNSQEMVIFITELTTNYYAGKYISEYGCEKYYKYNKEILLSNKRNELRKEIDTLSLL